MQEWRAAQGAEGGQPAFAKEGQGQVGGQALMQKGLKGSVPSARFQPRRDQTHLLHERLNDGPHIPGTNSPPYPLNIL